MAKDIQDAEDAVASEGWSTFWVILLTLGIVGGCIYYLRREQNDGAAKTVYQNVEMNQSRPWGTS